MSILEAIVIVQEGHQADIRTALVELCEVKIKLDFVEIPLGEDWGTADSLRFIKDKITVSNKLIGVGIYICDDEKKETTG